MIDFRILVTGATGLLGNNIARVARHLGARVTSLSRGTARSKALVDLNIEHLSADLSDSRWLDAIGNREFDCVIHAAAMIHIGWTKLSESRQVNCVGTRNVLEWARQNRTRVVYVSTVNCLPTGTSTQSISIDSHGRPLVSGGDQVPASYVITKREAQQVCNESIDRGDDCYVVYPGFMLGPNDWHLSSGRMVQALQKFRPWAPSGGCSVCDPRDVANAILRIATSGAESRHYVLAGTNVTYFDLWTSIAKKLGTRPPVIAMRKPSRVIGKFLADTLNRFRSQESDFNSAAIEIAQHFHYYDSTRAQRELAYQTRDYQESIDDSIEWLKSNGYLGERQLGINQSAGTR